ncbi:MAG: TonB-dependent receptor plug domain-containing protein [Betaproteobacteria bacterium]|nr:TonB-dependent receptor plug domain-containing protein [Betaproteobacteria bacterium]
MVKFARGGALARSMCGAWAAMACAAALAHDEVQAPTVSVIGHYETGIGTSDAASEGAVTSARIESRPLLRTGEVIELVPGMIVTQHSGDGKANQYYLRGYNLDHGTDFAIWVDGMPVNMPTHGHGQGYADINFMIPELVSRVNFRKGPYYAEEGDFSSAGVARIHYFDSIPQGIATVTLGSNRYRRGVFANSSDVGDGHLLYAFEATGNDGPWDRPENLRKLNAVLRLSQGSETSGFSLTAMAYDAKWDATDQIPQRAVDQGLVGRFGSLDPTDGGRTSRYSASFSGRQAMGRGTLNVDAYLINYRLDLWSDFTYFRNDPVRGDQFQQSDNRTVYGFNPHYMFEMPLFGTDSVTTVGVQSRFDDIGPVALYDTQARTIIGTTREDKVRQMSVGLYAQNAAQWNSWFRTLAGLRADHYRFDVASNIAANSGKRSDHLVSPKLSLIFGPWDRTEYFVNTGYGFHSNDARGTVIRVDPKNTAVAVAPVNPLVRTRGSEVGLRTELVPHVQSSLALWELRQDSELLFVGDAGTTEASFPSIRRGIEWTSYARPFDWLFVDAELAITRARFRDNPAGDRIPGAVERVATLGLTVEDLGPWFGALQVRHFGPRPLVEDNSQRSAGTTISNLRVGYLVEKNVRVYLDVLNLFGTKADDITYYYGSCLRNEVGVAPACPAVGGGDGVQDRVFHPVEPRQLRFSVSARF